MEENLKTTGKLRIVVTDEHGNVKMDREESNLVVNTGKSFVTSRMLGVASGVMSHMEVGTSSTAAAAGQTALVTPVAASRTALTSTTQATTTTSNDALTFVTSFAAGVGTGALTEAGIFNAASAGTMLCRTVFATVTKAAGDAMTITWTVTIS